MFFGKDGSTGRRGFMSGIGACSLALIASPLHSLNAAAPTRTLNLSHLHTKDQLKITYIKEGRFDSQALETLDFFMRDWRTNDILNLDRRLYDMLYILGEQLPRRGPIEIVSGYRSLKTNDMLRSRGRGAAKDSLHIQGMAVDFRMPGVRLSSLRRRAIELEMGGVGYYPESFFVHIDTGPVRYW